MQYCTPYNNRAQTTAAKSDLAGVVELPFMCYEVIVPQPGSRLEGGVMTQGRAELICSEEGSGSSGQVGNFVSGICRQQHDLQRTSARQQTCHSIRATCSKALTAVRHSTCSKVCSFDLYEKHGNDAYNHNASCLGPMPDIVYCRVATSLEPAKQKTEWFASQLMQVTSWQAAVHSNFTMRALPTCQVV